MPCSMSSRNFILRHMALRAELVIRSIFFATWAEQMEKTSFLAILTVLASVYYEITDIDWDEPDVNKWLEYMEQISKKEVVESQMNGGE